ncbi:granulocyte-macrophage colony-stimulating factor receptor subunit alpha-like [Elgaria multicarinata webbii]|uniref:granulocyte-macrophage colony-stimulating factor receptor subunit alpha-like n=1 Tax=Elgaria multicarinata webbii TaxID=159646 RepID=UPI002FCD3E16
MEATLRFAHMSWIIVLCSILHVAFLHEVGINGTNIEHFSCVVFSYTFKGPSMNCTWEVGSKAPPDTQYFLYFQYYKSRSSQEKEEKVCPYYISNEHRTHIGCYFPNVTVNQYSVHFRLNGSSTDSVIQPFTSKLQLYQHERLDPPHNITVNCPEPPLDCIVEWKPPPSSRKVHPHCFRYEIQILEGISSKKFSHGKKYILRFRTGGQHCAITTEFGEWSERIEFGTDPSSFPTIHLVLVVLGTISIIVLLFLICKRSHIWQKLTGPVPQPKSIIWQCEKNMEKAWVNQIPTAEEKITVVEEMSTSCRNV